MNRLCGILLAGAGGLLMQVTVFWGVVTLVLAYLWSIGYLTGEMEIDTKK